MECVKICDIILTKVDEMYNKNTRFSLAVLVLCLGAVSDTMAAPSVRVLGGGGVGATMSGNSVPTVSNGVSGAKPAVKAVPASMANRVNTSILGGGNLSAKKGAAVKVGSAVTPMQSIARTVSPVQLNKVGGASANTVSSAGRIPSMKLQGKIQSVYRPVQAAAPAETSTPTTANYYTKTEIDEMLAGLDIENVRNLTNNIQQTIDQAVQQINQESNTIYNAKTEQRELVYVVDEDDFDESMFNDLDMQE